MKILVCGDAMTDCYWRGDVSRISPEGPVPIVSISSTEEREGAAANVANNIEAMGVPCERIFGGGERIRKIRLLSRGQHATRIDFDHPQQPIQCDAAYEAALERCEIVVFADYAKGSLANIQQLIAKARAMGRTVLVDPKGHDYSKYRGASLIKPNRDEMKDLVGGWAEQYELDLKAAKFMEMSGIEAILLTQGRDGMTLYADGMAAHMPAEASVAVDVSGAGEAALSAFAAALGKGCDYLKAVRYAAKAAGLAVGSFGTTVLTQAEVFG